MEKTGEPSDEISSKTWFDLLKSLIKPKPGKRQNASRDPYRFQPFGVIERRISHGLYSTGLRCYRSDFPTIHRLTANPRASPYQELQQS